MTNEVAEIKEQAPALPTVTSYLEVISRVAADPSCDVDKLERLLAMQERVMTHQAQMDYTIALAGLQSELPVIKKRGKIKIGNNSQPYALWEDINDIIKPILQVYGFALSFRTGQDGDKITVTAVLSHKGGHSEETTMHLPSDVSGSKNNVQAVGSTTSYGKRYTAGALLNLTFTDEDDDGIKAGAGTKAKKLWRGPLKTTELKDKAREFSAKLNQVLAIDMLNALIDEYRPILKQLEVDLPEWWIMEDDQKGAYFAIENKRSELEAASLQG